MAGADDGATQRVDVKLRWGEAGRSEFEAVSEAGPELSHALLEIEGRRLLVAFASRRLASRIWKVCRQTREGAGAAAASNAPFYEIGWDWVSPAGERVLYTGGPADLSRPVGVAAGGRDVFRIDAQGRVELVEPETVRRHTQPSALPAVEASTYRQVEERDPLSLLQRLDADQSWSGAARYLEALGVHYGAAYYAFTVSIRDERELRRGLWIAGASDAVSLYINGKYLGTALPRGKSVALAGPLPWRIGENRVVVRAEILGHSNFHDATVPVTHLGSMRGLAPPVVLSAAAPGAVEYAAHLESSKFPSPDPAFLYGTPQPQGVAVEGAWELWRASRVEGVGERAPRAESVGLAGSFPCRVPAGRLVEIEVLLPAAGESLPLWAKLSGRGIRGELWLAGRLVGRVWLEEREDLLFTGGRWTDRIWLPSPWCESGRLTLRLYGTGKEGGWLDGIEWLYALGARPAEPIDEAAAG